MRYIVCITLLCSALTFAQNETETKHWNKSGNASLLFNHATFSNWVSGGADNISLNFLTNYTFHYKKDVWPWDTTFLVDYGLAKTSGSQFYKKTSDRFEVQSLLGKRLSKLWSYSAFFGFRTAFSNGYDYNTDAKGDEIRTKKSAFLSPAYLQLGLGLSWKEHDNLWMNISPVSPRYTLVNKFFTENLSVDETFFGVEKGKSSRLEFGAALNAFWLATLFENISFEQRLGLYSNYLDKPQNVDLDYQATLNMTVNKNISANLILHLVYDDNAVEALQVREVFGIGINMKL
ncbi:MAG: DUF3078 domain-containing protein [Bacteroidetes bacterium]|nr:DUF3078 domain-containing protein [Bacteroidota bacterium]MDA0888484.1 DUF3078 domain-containing protein [Bacteroidota bacterium]MDA1084127.1 DUF3078 domain-containing protein [Bacteroidota bacterium]